MKRRFYFICACTLVVLSITGCSKPGPKEWVYNNSIHYTGAYRFIAEDRENTDYPKWIVEKSIISKCGEMKVPSDWGLEKSKSSIQRIVNSNGEIMMEIGIMSFHLMDPFFNVMPNHCDPISWGLLKSRDGYRIYALTYESDLPATSKDTTVTIKKSVFFLSSTKGTYKNFEYNYGYYLCFNKAFIKDKIQYDISNQTIDAIINSFLPYDFK